MKSKFSLRCSLRTKTVKCFGVLLMLVIALFCGKAYVDSLARSIRNEDVSWSYGFTGVQIREINGSTEKLRGIVDVAPFLQCYLIEEMRNALSDPQRFVSAYVIMTMLAGAELHHNESNTILHWGNLKSTDVDGVPKFEWDKNRDLQERWDFRKQSVDKP